MANAFDQFDEPVPQPPQAQQQPGNFFDQFDKPANPFDQFDLGPTLATPFKALARGAGEGTGAVVAGAGIMTDAYKASLTQAFDEIDSGKPLSTWQYLTNPAVKLYANSDPERRAAMRQQIAADTSAKALQSAGETIAGKAQELLPLTPGEQESYWAKAPEAIGFGVPAIGGMVLTRGAGAPAMMTAGAALMGLQGADQGFKDAMAHGASLDDAYNAAYGGAAIQGGLGVLPVGQVLDKIDTASGGTLKRMLVGALTGAGSEGVINTVQQLLMNLQAKGLYDPERGLSEGVGEAAMLGALAGAATGAGLGALPKGVPTEVGAPKPQAVPEGTPVPEGAAPGTIPPPIPLNEPVGLKTPSGVVRVVPETVEGGNVIFRLEDGSMRGATISEFQRDIAEPPAPTVRPDNATTIPEPPPYARSTEEPPLPGVDDLNDFNPWAETETAPRPAPEPSPQQPLPLSDTGAADALARRVAGIEAEIARAEAGVEQRTPEQLKVMRQVADQLRDEAAGMLSRTTPARTGPEGAIAEPTPLGRLSVAARGLETEASTGRSLTEPVGSPAKRADIAAAAREEAATPLLQARPPVSEAERPLPPMETETGRLLPLSRRAAPSGEAPSAERVAPPEIARPVKPAAPKPETGPAAGRSAPKPESLIQFLASRGGIREEGGELANMGLNREFVPGRGRLVRASGQPLDMAREAASEAGFMGPRGRGLETVNDLLDALREEKSGRKQYLIGMQPEPAPREYSPKQMQQIQTENALRQLGEEPVGYTLEDVEAQLNERLAMMDAATVEDAIRIYEEENQRILESLSPEARDAVLEAGNAEDWTTEFSRAESGFTERRPPPTGPPQGGAEAGALPVGEGRAGEGGEPAAAPARGPAEEAGARVEPPVTGAEREAALPTERTPQGEQAVIPGAERSAQQAVEAQPERLRANVPQKAADEGLFGDAHKQRSFWGDETGAADPLWFVNLGRAIKTKIGGPETTDAIAAEAARLSRDTKPDTASSLNPANAFMTMPAALASRDAPSARYFNAILDQHRTAERLENEAIPKVVPYLGLDEKSQARVNKVLEYARLYEQDLTDDGRNIVIRTPTTRTPRGAAFPRLTRPGEIVALDAQETAAFHDLRNFFISVLHDLGQAIARETGYKGEFTEQAIRNTIGSNSAPAGERSAAERAMAIWQETVGAGRKGYVPFARYGNKYIKITPKITETPGRDAMPPSLEDGWFEFVPTSILDPRGVKALTDRITELRREFPADKFDLQRGDVSDLRQQTDTINIPALERIISRMDRGDDAAAAVDAVMKHVFEQRKAGFRKQSANIPGYSVDFPRAIVDYVRHSSAMIARLEHRADVDAAFDATQSHRAPGIAEYWKNHKAYMESNGGDFGSLRKIAFFQYLWGSPASTAVNLTQTLLVTAPQLAAWAGPRAAPLLADAMGEAALAVRVGPHGLYLDWSAIGRTPAERAMIDRMVKEGTGNPILAREFEGTQQMASKRLRPYSKRLSQVWEIGASGFNVAEQINRATAALAYYRAASNPALLKSLAKMYANDTRFQDMARGGLTPEKAAQWGVDETQYIGGKINRAPMQRGVGGLALQMRTYQLNTFRVLYKNMARMGYQGKIAGSLMAGGLIGVAGLYGIPFAEDADKAATTVAKWWNGVDPMIEMRLREFVSDEAMSEFGASTETARWLAEFATRGAGRSTGVDIGSRVGMGNVAPDGTMWTTIPILAATVDRGQQFWQAVKSGEPIGAAAQIAGAIGGKPAQDIVQAAALPYEGKRTRAGDLVVPPSEITAGEMAARATGFNPTEFARATERRYQEGRLAASTQAAASQLLRSAAAHFALAEDALGAAARQRGMALGKMTAEQTKQLIDSTPKYRAEMAAFNRILAENAERLNDPGIPDWQQIPMPTQQAMKAAIGRQIDYDQSVAKRTGKTKRGQLNELQQLFGQ